MATAKIYDYIIIGSGFGGSVAAMRLAEKGYSVLVIEKGKKYNNEDFPKTNWNFRKFFWLPALRCFGIQQISLFREAFILTGVGVGGGSLVYANTHLVPPDDFFMNPAWSHFGDWKGMLMSFFDKARFMLGTTSNTFFSRADDVLREVAGNMNRIDSFRGVDVGVYFGDENNETDPYFNGLGPLRKGCTQCAGCMVGCRHNAKNTLDKNYLFFAKKFGAEIFPEHKAYKIEYSNGLYRIHAHSSTSWFSSQKGFTSKGIVFSGGVLGTMDLLLKQKYMYKTLAGISETLGENIRTNSEMLCGVTSRKEKLNNGIAITSVFNPDEHTHMEVVKYPDGSDSMKLFATLAAGPGRPVVRTLKLLVNVIAHPLTFLKHLFGSNWAKNTVIFLVMQTHDNAMKMILKKFPFRRISILNKSKNKVPSYIDIGQKVMYRYAEKVNGIPQNAVTEILFNMSSTAHILGGCPMGRNINEGVINEKFEAFGYPNMYVLDGSIIPCNPGVNPSLTITALSEYAMSLIPEKEGNSNIPLEHQIKNVSQIQPIK